MKLYYFDNAATSLHKPQEVKDAVLRALDCSGNAGRGAGSSSITASRTVYECRQAIADIIGADSPLQIAFTKNSTEALNIAIKGVLNAGDHVISTVLEHNSVLRPLYSLREQGVEISFVGVDKNGSIDVEDIAKMIKPNTKAIVTTHASNLIGNMVDIERVGKIARENGLIYIVDASQTAGMFDIDVNSYNIDILCMTGHKSLLGPQGTGAIYVREGVEIKQLLIGGSGIETFNEEHPSTMPTRLEAGTLNSHGIAGLLAGIRYIEKHGAKKLRDSELALMRRFYESVKGIDGITIYGNFDEALRAPVVTLNLDGFESDELSLMLEEEYGIITRSGGHCAPLLHKALGTDKGGAVRFSFSHFNTEEEIDYAINAILAISRGDE